MYFAAFYVAPPPNHLPCSYLVAGESKGAIASGGGLDITSPPRALCMPSTTLPGYVTTPPNPGLKEARLPSWRKQPQLVSIARIHGFPLLPNFEGDLII